MYYFLGDKSQLIFILWIYIIDILVFKLFFDLSKHRLHCAELCDEMCWEVIKKDMDLFD
jgi:hypothetical protein